MYIYEHKGLVSLPRVGVWEGGQGWIEEGKTSLPLEPLNSLLRNPSWLQIVEMSAHPRFSGVQIRAGGNRLHRPWSQSVSSHHPTHPPPLQDLETPTPQPGSWTSLY